MPTEITNTKYTPNECDCERCSRMCRAPCCGTPGDIKKLIEAGYAKRLMLDDLPSGPDMIKPALKGSEGEEAPWEVSSEKGCTFWKKGKCELHDLNLKPTQGKLVHHSFNREQYEGVEEIIRDSWETPEAGNVIEMWKETIKNA